MDRIHRNSRNFMAMMDQLRKEGKEFASVTESLDTSTAMGRFVMDIIQRIAQLESDQIGERVEDIFHYRQRNDDVVYGPAPYGLRSHKAHRKVVPHQARVIRRMYDMVMADNHPNDVGAALRQARVKPDRGGSWRGADVLKLLSNPELAG